MIVSRKAVSMTVLMGLLACTAVAVNIETVPVGDPGNVADTRRGTPGFGSVAYTYNIGKYEVTAGQYCEFLNKIAATDTYGLYNPDMANAEFGSGITQNGESGSYTYSVDLAFINRPVGFVSYWDASRFTNWLHNGQPSGAQGAGTTETGAYALNGYNGSDGRTIQRNADWKWAVTSQDEWYKAAYYKGGSANAGYWDYPTSSNTAPGRDLDDASGNNANYYGDPFPIQSPYYTTVVGEFENSDSPYGTFDQGGNVWEWNEGIVSGTQSWRCSRGGSYGLGDVTILRAGPRSVNNPVTEFGIFGFRVVAVPEPGSALLLGVGVLAAVLRRRSA